MVASFYCLKRWTIDILMSKQNGRHLQCIQITFWEESFVFRIWLRHFPMSQIGIQHWSSQAAVVRRQAIADTKFKCFNTTRNWKQVPLPTTLRWRHKGCDSVSNHQPRECLFSRSIRRRSKKTSKFCVTGLCAGNSPETGEFPAQRASNAENISIWWRHHAVHLNECCDEINSFFSCKAEL